jgi:DNA-binding response OmpR family regulator
MRRPYERPGATPVGAGLEPGEKVPVRVLIVEDHELIGSSLQRALRASGYEATVAGTVAAATDAIDAVTGTCPDLVVCDLGLPDGDGLDLVDRLRVRHPLLPVVVLTARDEEADVVAGLAAGAVDYVTKPFRLAELLARIAAHLRHRRAVEGAVLDDVVTVGDLEIRLGARRVLVAGGEVELRPKEFDLLARLAADAGRVVRREDLMNDVWDEHWWGSTKTLDVHLNALRRHLGEGPGAPSRITAVRGVGYRLDGG